MPCSRSARSPSVSSERSRKSWPMRRLVCSTCSSWSTRTCLESYSRRPMSVLLPSSTEPAVAKRSRSAGRSVRRRKTSSPSEMRAASCSGVWGTTLPLSSPTIPDEGLPRSIRSSPAACGPPSPPRSRGRRRASARAQRLLTVDQLHERTDRVEHAVAREDLALVGKVDRGNLELLLGDVLPDVELGPIGDGKHARMLAAADAPVVEVPDLRALALG